MRSLLSWSLSKPLVRSLFITFAASGNSLKCRLVPTRSHASSTTPPRERNSAVKK